MLKPNAANHLAMLGTTEAHVFNAYVKGARTFAEVIAYLHAQGIRPRTGSEYFAPQAVRQTTLDLERKGYVTAEGYRGKARTFMPAKTAAQARTIAHKRIDATVPARKATARKATRKATAKATRKATGKGAK